MARVKSYELLLLKSCFFRFAVLLLLSAVSATALVGAQFSAGKTHTQNSRAAAEQGKSGEPADAAGSAQAQNGAAPGQKTAPKPVTMSHLAALPQPLPQSLTEGIDPRTQSKYILEHLNEIIRFYRMAVTPIQKTGEPSDMLYAEQAQSTAVQIAQLAFQSARDEAILLARVQGSPGAAPQQAQQGEAQRLNVVRAHVEQQMRDLQAKSDALEAQMSKARGAGRAALLRQKNELQGQIGLVSAAAEALAKVAGVSVSQSNSGLQGDIDRLQHSIPEVIDSKVKPVANTLESLGSMHDAGVTTQAQLLFQLIGTRRAIDQRIDQVNTLRSQADNLRTPLMKIMRATMEEGQRLESEAAASAASPPSQSKAGKTPRAMPDNTADEAAARKKTYDELTDAFKTISGVAVPISQEILLLEQAKGNLGSWRAAVDSERQSLLHALLFRVVLIAIALGVVLGFGEVWRRAVSRYVQDLRRRRQLLVIRRMVIGFLSGVVIILGFVTQFSSLATFAGFITAGIAVGLQTVLLSVAAYFFIVGRYGVKVGDRITVANVTGDVVEVGLVRFYLMELAGTGSALHPTGRIAVFANSVLFQTGTPLYKQIPGTDYVWHEVSVKLKADTENRTVLEKIRRAVEQVYDGYRRQIEQEHATTEAWMDTTLPSPTVESRLQYSDGLQFVVLYPVRVGKAAETDDEVVRRLVEIFSSDPAAAQVVSGAPEVRAVMKA